MAVQIFLSLESLPFISTHLYFVSPTVVEQPVLDCSHLQGWCGKFGCSVCKMVVCVSDSRRKTKPLAHVIMKSHRRCCPLGLPDVWGCFIFTDRQLPLGFMIIARWFLSMLWVLSISFKYTHVCMDLAGEEGLV